MNTGDILHGFRVERIRRFEELDGSLYEMKHVKTGAELCWLDRKDENKAFSIAFRTLPEDSTGVFHILEHSVLCGSDKYPVKEPFVELLKSSVQTFLNAMTYPDKTVYPVSTRNDKDLLNLMDIYLDAVFHPAIYSNRSIFRQEGWHYEDEGDGNYSYQGVVLNEMKGAFASPDSLMEDSIMKMLFPDNCYGFVSGGDPECIPDLTYEQFISMHRKYYHPSNSLISLVGSVDMDAALERIDSYLKDYERRDRIDDIPLQRPAEKAVRRLPYETGENEPLDERTIIASASLLGTYEEKKKDFAAVILGSYLTGDNDAPLKREILDRGLAQDFTVMVEDGIEQSIIGWQAINTDEDKLDDIKACIKDILERIVSEGLDTRRLRACFNRFAFRMRDNENSGYPRSLEEAVDMLDTWLYGGDPAEGLLVEDALMSIEEDMEGSLFTDLIKQYLLDDSHEQTLILYPSRTIGEEKKKKEEKHLEARMASWSEEDRNRIMAEMETMKEWQQTPDSEEALSTIPMLKISDLSKEPEKLIMEKEELDGVKILRHTIGSRIAYMNLVFDADDVEKDDVPVLNLLGRMLGVLATSKHDRESLAMEVKEKSGRLNFSPNVISGKTPDYCNIKFMATAAFLADKATDAVELIKEILTETQFDDRDLLREILNQMSFGAKMSVSQSGHSFAISRALANCSVSGEVNEALSGITFNKYLEDAVKKDDDGLDTILCRMKELCERIVSRDRLTLSVSEAVSNEAVRLIVDSIPDKGAESSTKFSTCERKMNREGISIPSQVGYAGMTSNLLLHGMEYSGHMPVLANILNYTYLWSTIRVQGGAYGCGFIGRNNGETGFYTYRDPQPVHSLEVFKGAADFIRGFCSEDPDITGFILSAVSILDPLRSASEKMLASEARYFRGLDDELYRRYYRELIDTTVKDLLDLCPVLEMIIADDNVCIVAGKDELTSEDAGLSNIIEA